MSGTIVVNTDSKEVRAKVEKAGLSVNKYLVYDRAQKEGINLSVEDLHNNSVRQVLDKANIPLKKISQCASRCNRQISTQRMVAPLLRMAA